jgi:hypothetical protein
VLAKLITSDETFARDSHKNNVGCHQRCEGTYVVRVPTVAPLINQMANDASRFACSSIGSGCGAMVHAQELLWGTQFINTLAST